VLSEERLKTASRLFIGVEKPHETPGGCRFANLTESPPLRFFYFALILFSSPEIQPE